MEQGPWGHPVAVAGGIAWRQESEAVVEFEKPTTEDSSSSRCNK